MVTLPIQRIILYKHGVGYFERHGTVKGQTLRLNFPRHAMDDILKSLIVLDRGSGQVVNLDFETPENREELIAKGSIHLSYEHSLLDLLRDLRGRHIRCTLAEEPETNVEGLIIGLDTKPNSDNASTDNPQQQTTLSIYQPDHHSVRIVALDSIKILALLDDAAAADLSYFLRASQSDEDRRNATLHLSKGDHDLLVGYIAPAPAWRVSYRMLVDKQDEKQESEQSTPSDKRQATPTDSANAPSESPNTAYTVLLQGWGLFDNQLDENLENVYLTLVAGMPVSFRYRLYEPKTPQRPLVEDEERTVTAPIAFDSAPPPAPAQVAKTMGMREESEEYAAMHLSPPELETDEFVYPQESPTSGMYLRDAIHDDMEGSIQVDAIGGEHGALFAYHVSHPISVARGLSAMVPILSHTLPCQRDLLYNKHKLPDHPVVSLRITNSTGLTLERGPVTVLEHGDYAGEAIVPFTRDQSEMIVPYAVEMGITVEEQIKREQHMAQIRVSNHYMQIQEYQLLHTTYHLTSTLADTIDVVIEHTPGNEYELFNTPKPDEHSASFVRWRIACVPNTRTVFEVHERKMNYRYEEIRGLSQRKLRDYLKNNFLDKTTYNALEDVLKTYTQIEDAQSRIQQIERERQAIYKHQKQIQGNLGPLGQKGKEGELRTRYVQELTHLEDQLGTLATEEKQLHAQIESLEQENQKKLDTMGTKGAS